MFTLLFVRTEVQEKCVRLQSEAEQALAQLEQAELKASAATKQAGTIGAQLSEAQVRRQYTCLNPGCHGLNAREPNILNRC